MRALTERQLDILLDLESVARQHFVDRLYPEWVRPLDLGGSSTSHHSATLSVLERRGYVQSQQRMPHMSRGSKVYRITDDGLKALEMSLVCV